MKYKKITFACVLLGLSLYAGVCAATVREVADEAPASKQTIIADKKDKKLLNKKQMRISILYGLFPQWLSIGGSSPLIN